MKNLVALDSFLSLFQSYFAMPNVTEICINRPYEIWIEQAGKFRKLDAAQLSHGTVSGLTYERCQV